MIETDEGLLEFQDYFVRRRQEPEVRGLHFIDQHAARSTRAVLDAIGEAELIVIGPSNPFVSIGPILALREVREAIGRSSGMRVAVSPIVGGRALKGPADRMLASLGHPVTPVAVAKIYGDWLRLDSFVIDEVDAGLASEIEALGVTAVVLSTVMRNDADRAALAAALLEA
jgi:LPPG:FO 2-phospho-L-lactate transferase